MALTDKLIAIGDGFRSSRGTSVKYSLDEMAVLAAEKVGGGESGGEEWIGDGNTHLWISLAEGRTSPMLGIGVNGTVTVDWGDGSTPDVLTGTSVYTVKWTPNHEYGAAGDYIITLAVEGQAALQGSAAANSYCYILRQSAGVDGRNPAYQSSLRRAEIGNDVLIEAYAFNYCYNLTSVFIPSGVDIGIYAFCYCYGLTNVIFSEGVKSIGASSFGYCYGLKDITIPESVKQIDDNAFYECRGLKNVTLGGYKYLNIGTGAFFRCDGITNVTFSGNVSSISENAFYFCGGVKFYDFTALTAIPSLSATSAFLGMNEDCRFLVPSNLLTSWKSTTNWSAYAGYILEG